MGSALVLEKSEWAVFTSWVNEIFEFDGLAGNSVVLKRLKETIGRHQAAKYYSVEVDSKDRTIFLRFSLGSIVISHSGLDLLSVQIDKATKENVYKWKGTLFNQKETGRLAPSFQGNQSICKSKKEANPQELSAKKVDKELSEIADFAEMKLQ